MFAGVLARYRSPRFDVALIPALRNLQAERLEHRSHLGEPLSTRLRGSGNIDRAFLKHYPSCTGTPHSYRHKFSKRPFQMRQVHFSVIAKVTAMNVRPAPCRRFDSHQLSADLEELSVYHASKMARGVG